MTASRLMTAAGNDRKVGALDETHLDRMTLGDRRLEREVLELFLRQTTIMLDRIVNAAPAFGRRGRPYVKGFGERNRRMARGAGGRTSGAGSRRGGRRNVRCARSDADLADAIDELKAASLEASAAIGGRLTVLLADFSRER